MSPQAIAHYEQSADYYKGEESNRYPSCPPQPLGEGPRPCYHRPPSPLSAPFSSANKCLLKVAGYAAQLEQYQKAIDIYEQVGAGGAGMAPHPACQCPSSCLSSSPVPCPPPPRILCTSLGHPHALTLCSAWLNTLSTHDPMRCHRPLPRRALPTLLTGRFPGGPRVRPTLKN